MMALGTKRVLVTGGTSGIGLAIATRLLEKGAKVTLVGRNVEKLKSLLESSLTLRMPWPVICETATNWTNWLTMHTNAWEGSTALFIARGLSTIVV